MRILVVDDEELSRRSIANFLRGQLGHEVIACANGAEAWDAFQQEPAPVVITDIRMPVMDGIQLLNHIAASPQGSATQVILITGFADVSTAVDALRLGASDYLRKPIDIRDIARVISQIEVEAPSSGAEPSEAETVQVPGYGSLVTASEAMRHVVALARRLHQQPALPLLLQGDTGTGKEVIAHLIHQGDEGSNASFVAVNCAAIAPSLFESELFGYEAGAFTGARKEGLQGKLEQAAGGTLLLDEIGEMPLELQPKLLRALETQEITRIGGRKAIRCRFRLIASTNRNLAEEVQLGRFRSDLYYRLNTAQLYLPTLSERPADIRALARHFLTTAAQHTGSRMSSIEAAAEERLCAYTWPGNVRELKNVIDRIVFLYDDTELRNHHLEALLSTAAHREPASAGKTCLLDPDRIVLPEDGIDLKRLELSLVQQALAKCENNKSHTARFLGLTRRELDSRLRKLQD